MVKMIDIANELSISRTTVSYALNNRADELKISPKTVQKVLETAKRMKYVPHLWARNLAGAKTPAVSLLISDLSLGWGPKFLKGITDVLDATNSSLFLGIHMRQPERLARELEIALQRRDEGVICCSPTSSDIKCFYDFIENGGNLIFAQDRIESLSKVGFVGWDIEPAVQVAIEHLVATGRKKIGFLGSDTSSWASKVRYKAFVKAMDMVGIEVKENWVGWEKPSVIPHDAIAEMFSSSDKPDALLVINDPLAIMALEAVARLGVKVPEDVGIVGLGDIPTSSLSMINLTTVQEPSEEIGMKAARLLLEPSEKHKKETVFELVPSTELKIRGTT